MSQAHKKSPKACCNSWKMKINTKKSKPIKGSPGCMVSDNPYVDVDHYPGDPKEVEDIAEEFGREVKYMGTVVFTPVKKSKRNANEKSEDDAPFSLKEVEEISTMFSSFKISKKISDKKALQDEEQEKQYGLAVMPMMQTDGVVANVVRSHRLAMV